MLIDPFVSMILKTAHVLPSFGQYDIDYWYFKPWQGLIRKKYLGGLLKVKDMEDMACTTTTK